MLTNPYSTMTGFQGVYTASLLASSSGQIQGSKYINTLSTAPITGSSVALATPNISNGGLSVIQTSSDYRQFLLETPVSGVKKEIYVSAVQGSTAGIAAALIYSSTPGLLDKCFVNSVAGVASTSNCLLTANRGTVVSLVGLSSYQWLIANETTRSSTAAISLSSST